MSQASYTAGDQVAATTTAFANASVTPEPVRFQLAVSVPGGAFPVFDIGVGGWFFMPDDFSVNLGPVPMFVVDGTTPLGAYSLDCAMLDPATGEVLSSSQAPFTVH